MIDLSPTAMRFIRQALEAQDDAALLGSWEDWASSQQEAMPPYVAQVALHALSGMALSLENKIMDPGTPSQEAAVLENDLGYIADLESTLLAVEVKPVRLAM